MSGLNLFALGLPAAITILVLIGLYKLFIRKKKPSLFHTPFDQVTGQTEVTYHEEQEVLVEEEGHGEGKEKQHIEGRTFRRKVRPSIFISL